MPPLVSIVVPSYQHAPFLRDALDSILRQDYEPIEVLVMDGGSTDGSQEILAEYGDRIWFRSHRDSGQTSAINEGFGRARGEIVAWLNSDDKYHPGAVRSAVEALAAAPDAGLVHGAGDIIDEHGRTTVPAFGGTPCDLWQLIYVATPFIQPAVFFRRHALFEVGLLNERMTWAFDWDLFIRMGKRFPFAHHPDLFASARVYPATKTNTGGLPRLREVRRIRASHVMEENVFAAALWSGVRLCATLPEFAVDTARRLLPGAPARLRRWRQNAQGVWPDGLVGRIGQLLLRSPGMPAILTIRGTNLGIEHQVVTLRAGAESAESAVLAPNQRFELRVIVPESTRPVSASLQCARTTVAAPLDATLGPRHAGCQIERPSLSPV